MKKNGFTLIELLIVLVIIAMLASITFLPLFTMMKKQEVESTISNVAFSVKNLLNKARMESTKDESYIKFEYSSNALTATYERDSSKVFKYTIPEDYFLEASPTSVNLPFNSSNIKGYYFGYFVDENSASITINNNYAFLVISKYDNNIIREIVIEDSLPWIRGD